LDHPIGISPSSIPALLRRHGLQPDKRLGQNFLVDAASLHKILDSAELTSQDLVLEIGAGLGNLTCLLAAQAGSVVAIELDERFIPPLQEVLAGFDNVRIVQGDILSISPLELLAGHYRPGINYTVVANIPYYITSAVIRHLLEASIRPQRMILTVQREVAERICAQPGHLSLLALSVQVYGRPYIASHIPAGAFFPPPKVDSAVVRVDIYPQPVIEPRQLDIFFKLIKAGFSQKRKTLRNALAGALGLSLPLVEALLRAAQIDPMRRAETLDLSEWSRLTAEYSLTQNSAS